MLDRLEVYGPELEIMLGVRAFEDDSDFRENFEKKAAEMGFKNIRACEAKKEFIAHMTKEVHICVLDHFIDNETTGLSVMEEIFKINPYAFVIIVSGQVSKGVVIEYLNKGAWKYVDKGIRRQDDYEAEVFGYVEQALKEIRSEVLFFSGWGKQLEEAKRSRDEITQVVNKLTNEQKEPIDGSKADSR